MELDYGLVNTLCRGSEQCELSGVVKGIPLKLRETLLYSHKTFVTKGVDDWMRLCLLDMTLPGKKTSCKAYFSFAFELRARGKTLKGLKEDS